MAGWPRAPASPVAELNGEAKLPALILHSDDIKILAALAKKETTQDLYALEGTTELSRKTISTFNKATWCWLNASA